MDIITPESCLNGQPSGNIPVILDEGTVNRMGIGGELVCPEIHSVHPIEDISFLFEVDLGERSNLPAIELIIRECDSPVITGHIVFGFQGNALAEIV